MSPEKRVGSAANLTIFLGILYTSLGIAAISGFTSLISRGYGTKSIIIGCMIIGLGYGTRYGSKTCLYIVSVLFVMLAVFFFYNFMMTRSVNSIVRVVLSLWAAGTLVRTIPVMIRLKVAGSVPDRSNRYRDYFLKRIQYNNK